MPKSSSYRTRKYRFFKKKEKWLKKIQYQIVAEHTGSHNYVEKNTSKYNSSSHELPNSCTSAAWRCGIDNSSNTYDDISYLLNSPTSSASGVDDASDDHDIGDLLNSSSSSQISSTISGSANNTSHENVMTILKDPSTELLTLKDKLKKWAVDNVDNLYLRTVEKLLDISKSEGHTELPSTAHKLLGYKHFVEC